MRLDDVSIPRKLALAFAIPLIATVIAGAFIYSANTKRDLASEQATSINAQRLHMLNAAATHLDMAQTVRGYILTGVQRQKRLYEEAGSTFSIEMGKAIAIAETLNNLRGTLEPLKKLQSTSRDWKAEIGDKIIVLADNPDTRAQAVELAISPRSSQFQQAFHDAKTEANDALIKLDFEVQAAETRGRTQSQMALMVGALTTLLASIIAAILLTRNLAFPLERLTQQIRELAGGQTNISFLGVNRKDGIGSIAIACETFKSRILERENLARETAEQRRLNEETRNLSEQERSKEMIKLKESLTIFASALGELARGNLLHKIEQELYGPAEEIRHDYNAAVEQLKKTIAAVVQTSQTVAMGSNELTSNADDMARRTEQQAANLEETAAALEQITETVKRTAKGAEQARDTVNSTTVDAEKGGEIVRNAIEAMGHIEKSSGQIGQIIGVIDEIAFQTNLLALNAGVEAARAGDSGKGFAVVASEVRALAQRSAEAAKEIKTLISSSSAQVEQGVRLVCETGTALERIVTQVAEIKVSVTAIAVGASEQAPGLQEINNAVGQMDQITQQNAAMVEESVASSHTLANEARKLANFVSGFRTDAEPTPNSRATERAVPVNSAKTATSRAPVPVRKVANGGFVPSSPAGPRSDHWEEF